MAREPWRVAQDVLRGYVTPDVARKDYGVVMAGESVDEEATRLCRAGRAPPFGHFDFGPERNGYEAQWSDDAYGILTAILADLPIHWRFFAKTEIFRRMAGRSGADGVLAAFQEVCARFPELPVPSATKEAAE
jgi:N-methylhydantoinase B